MAGGVRPAPAPDAFPRAVGGGGNRGQEVRTMLTDPEQSCPPLNIPVPPIPAVLVSTPAITGAVLVPSPEAAPVGRRRSEEPQTGEGWNEGTPCSPLLCFLGSLLFSLLSSLLAWACRYEKAPAMRVLLSGGPVHAPMGTATRTPDGSDVFRRTNAARRRPVLQHIIDPQNRNAVAILGKCPRSRPPVGRPLGIPYLTRTRRPVPR